MKVYAFVPAKGTSERIENKNIKFLDGERLYIRALKTLLQCKEIDKVFLDTDSEEMYEMVNYLPVKFMKRDHRMASNKIDGHKMMLNEIQSFPDADIYVQLLCTSPFVESATIDNAIREIKNNAAYDSAILMKKEKCYFWQNGKPAYDKEHIPNSINLPETITESMGLYVIKKETALKEGKRYGNSPLLLFGKQHELIDVNVPEDFVFAEIFAKGIKRQENQKLRLVKHFVTSSALSDLLDDMEVEKNKKCGGVVGGFTVNIPNSVLLGRASTLKLRKLKKNEDYKGIYSALESYEGISENNIIIVENEAKDYAYFGDLNARLAIRNGASGAIIDGATRDKKFTELLNFPVFCKAYNSKDVRRRATVDYINKPVNICGVTVNPNDLVFIDEGAMVVIYQDFEEEVINRVLNTFKNEFSIAKDILNGFDVEKIIDANGAF